MIMQLIQTGINILKGNSNMTLNIKSVIEKNTNDISTFEHYNSTWDKVIFDIIEKGETSIFDIQDYFDYYNYEWKIFLDALAYFRYVDFLYPNLTVQRGGNYITRKVTITKEEYEEIIKNRKNKNNDKISYETIQECLNNYFINDIDLALHLVNANGQLFTKEQKQTIYKFIAKDMVYATESYTHMTFEDLEYYCSQYKTEFNQSPYNSFCCKVYEIDDLKDFDKHFARAMMVFACGKTSELSTNILEEIMNGEELYIELFSLSTNSEIKKNYQIIAIYPWQLGKEDFDLREQFLLNCIDNSQTKVIHISQYGNRNKPELYEVVDNNARIIDNKYNIHDLQRVALISNKMEAKQRVVVDINNLRSVAVVVSKYKRYQPN